MTVGLRASVAGVRGLREMRDPLSDLQWLAWVTSLAASGCAALGALTHAYFVSAVAAVCGHAFAFFLCMGALGAERRMIAGRGIDAILSGLPQVLNLALALSVLSEVVRPYGGKLAVLHYAGYQGAADVYPFFALLTALVSLSAVPLSTGGLIARPTTPRMSRRAVGVLLAVGALGLTATLAADRSASFASRGDGSSQGIVTVAYWAAAVGIACLVSELDFDSSSRTLWIAGAIELVALLLAANRTPLILIGCAVVVRLAKERPRTLSAILPMMLPLGLLVASYLSVWRGRLRDALPSDPGHVLAQIAADPVGSFLNVGVDSVDGYFLSSRLLENGFRAQPLDPFIAVLNFIPRALWEGKPTLLGSRIGVDYLGFSSGGIFLSGPGYLALVSGSVVLGAVMFVFVIISTRLVVCRYWDRPVLSVCGLFFTLNFIIAGDAFNLFLALQASLLWGAAHLVAKASENVVAH